MEHRSEIGLSCCAGYLFGLNLHFELEVYALLDRIALWCYDHALSILHNATCRGQRPVDARDSGEKGDEEMEVVKVMEVKPTVDMRDVLQILKSMWSPQRRGLFYRFPDRTERVVIGISDMTNDDYVSLVEEIPHMVMKGVEVYTRQMSNEEAICLYFSGSSITFHKGGFNVTPGKDSCLDDGVREYLVVSRGYSGAKQLFDDPCWDIWVVELNEV